MRINHNIASLNTYRQLTINNSNQSKALEKLSSGLRINRAGDDAAGLAISEKMRAQIRGLDQASRNAQDAISLIQTAEGALNETHSILQRMRELAVQSATDTNTEADRAEIQKEINQLTSEINRIGNTTEFNTMKLLNGDRAVKNITSQEVSYIEAGKAGDVKLTSSFGVTVSEDSWKSAIGDITVEKDTADQDAINWEAIDLTAGASVTITKDNDGNLNIQLAATDKDGNAFAHETTLDAEAMKLAASSGKYSVSFHGISFDVDVEKFEDVTNGAKVEIDFTKKYDPTSTDENVTDTYKLENDFASGGADFGATGISIDGTNTALIGIASLEIEFNGIDVIVKGYDASGKTLLNDKTTLDAATLPAGIGNSFKYSENGISFEFELIKDPADPANAITEFKTNKIDISSLTGKVATRNEDVDIVVDNSLKMQIGANTGQSMSIDISDMRSLALGISSTAAGATKDVIDSMGQTATAYFTKIANVTKGTDNVEVEYALDVSTAEKAAAAIKVIDDSIVKVSSERSKLGAFQNRLEHTINNLGTSSENLTASESRIRDVDMAKEMMEFTKNNILQQAAQAMLAQANQMPQGVLQLLR